MEGIRDKGNRATPSGVGCLRKVVGVGLGLILGALAGVVVGLVAGVGIAIALGVL
jgi:hypothetical protein